MTQPTVSIAVRTAADAARPVSASNPVPVTLVATSPGIVGGAYTDRSGTITSGGTSQQIAAANTARRYLLIQNHSDINMWVNFGTAAVASQPSILLYANGGAIEPLVVPTEAVHLIGATTGKAFTCKEA